MRFRRFGSVLFLILYIFSMFQTLVPVLSFKANHEYIRTHLCRSLTQPEFSDCDGFCYLKKSIDEHQHNDHESQNTASSVPNVPFIYLPEINAGEYAFTFPSSDKNYAISATLFPESIYPDIQSPPPRA